MLRQTLRFCALGLVGAALAGGPVARAGGGPAFLAPDTDNSAAFAKDPNARQPDGSTALQWAVYGGNVTEVQRLLKAGADIHASNNYGATALSLAAGMGDLAILRALLQAGADPNEASREGQSALMVVARTGNLDAANALIRAGADVNAREKWGQQSPLMWAAAAHQPAMISLLLKHGAKPDLLSTVREWPRKVTAEPREKSMDRGGFAALHYAAREGCVACVAALVKGGADIDIADGQGTTPLIMALMNLNYDTAKALIDQGANINLWDFVGQTPLYAAVDTHQVPTGARPDVASTDQTTAMDIIQLLIARGANVNAQLKLRLPGRSMPGDRNGDFRVLTTGATPLMRAAVGCDVAAIEVLIKAGALIDLPIADGTTPFFATVIQAAPRARNKTEQQALAAMRVLKAAGADPRKAVGFSWRVLHIIHLHTPDHARVPGSTPLMMAAVRDWKQVAQQLVEWGVDIDAKDEDGMTALDYAMGRERYGFLQPKPTPNQEMAGWLRKLGAKVENTNAPAWPPLNVPQIRAIVPELMYF